MSLLRRINRGLWPGVLGALLVIGAATMLPVGYAVAGSCGPQGASLIQGPKGGCYYINRNGNKTYVDRSCCH